MINDSMALDGEQIDTKTSESSLLLTAKTVYANSTDYLDSSVRKKVEANNAHFHNKHAKGSKFLSANYRNRNKMFHPKTRNGIRSSEAAFAAAMFSTSDLVTISAFNDNDERQQASAEIHQGLLNYRLENTIKWFLTCMGAYQDGQVNGVCATYNHWKYEEKITTDTIPYTDESGQAIYDPTTNEPFMQEVERVDVIRDEPVIDLIPIENLRFDPAADWRDPIQTSTYVIREVPMYAGDILARMEVEDSKTGSQKWHKYELSELLTANEDKADDSTRRSREPDSAADKTETQEGNEFTVIWLREYFIREKGEELVFWTVGDDLLLSEPEPLEEVYLHGERPITLGICILEAHKTYPSSPVELNFQLQERANSLINQRADNVDLVLNKRYYIRRGSKIDVNSLMRNTPGGGVMMENITQDIRTESTPDVTGSSYAEQDRLDVGMDESAGAFSQSSVQNNRALSETVGGMEMMNSGASAISEYMIRTFIETWVEPTLRQLVKLEAKYETDMTVLAVAAGKSEMFQRYGENVDLDEILDAELTVRVNVGMGATNPKQKLERMRTGFMTVGQLAPNAIPRIKEEEIIKEVFGAVGYKDGARFFKNEDELAQQQQQQQAPPPDPMLSIKAQELKIKENNIGFEQRLAEAKFRDNREKWMAELALKEQITIESLRQRTGLEEIKLQTTRQIAAGKINNDQTKLRLQAENLAQNHDTF